LEDIQRQKKPKLKTTVMNARFLKLLDYPEASLFIDSEDLHDFEMSHNIING